MKKKVLWLLILIPIFVMAMAIEFVLGYEIYNDLSYGEKAENIMDVYIPDVAYDREVNGCILLIHGGSWSGGDKGDEAMMARFLANNGYIAASINYSLSADEGYNVGIVLDEIESAFQKLVEFCAEKQIKVDKYATYGYSAGAHLSMLYSFSCERDISFVANMAGPAAINFEIWGDHLSVRIAEILSGGEITEEMIEGDELTRLLESYSPASYVDSDTPPVILAYGGKDTLVTMENGEALIEKLEDYGVKYDYVFFPNSDHTLLLDFGQRIKFACLVVDYCNEYFD